MTSAISIMHRLGMQAQLRALLMVIVCLSWGGVRLVAQAGPDAVATESDNEAVVDSSANAGAIATLYPDYNENYLKDVEPLADADELRVISLSPNITETLFAIGAGERIVGVTSLCNYPEAAKELPSCGAYIDTSFERIAALRPDAIFVLGDHDKVVEFAEKRDITVVHVRMDTLREIYQEMVRLGVLLDVEESAREAADTMAAEMSAIKRQVAERVNEPFDVFISLGHIEGDLTSLHTAGGTSFLSEALAFAGGANIYDDVDRFYPSIDRETLIARAPEVIFEMALQLDAENDTRKIKSLVRDWRKLNMLPAVQNERVYIMTEDFMMTPGPRIVEITRTFRDYLYPEWEQEATTTSAVEASSAETPSEAPEEDRETGKTQ